MGSCWDLRHLCPPLPPTRHTGFQRKVGVHGVPSVPGESGGLRGAFSSPLLSLRKMSGLAPGRKPGSHSGGKTVLGRRRRRAEKSKTGRQTQLTLSPHPTGPDTSTPLRENLERGLQEGGAIEEKALALALTYIPGYSNHLENVTDPGPARRGSHGDPVWQETGGGEEGILLISISYLTPAHGHFHLLSSRVSLWSPHLNPTHASFNSTLVTRQ